ncbi:hypothetical protein Pelo_5242 [Pelomyxa schiedti]|nr:hypothetical protein Pelo_5242 [Pelomyxa schiedti]
MQQPETTTPAAEEAPKAAATEAVVPATTAAQAPAEAAAPTAAATQKPKVTIVKKPATPASASPSANPGTAAPKGKAPKSPAPQGSAQQPPAAAQPPAEKAPKKKKKKADPNELLPGEAPPTPEEIERRRQKKAAAVAAAAASSSTAATPKAASSTPAATPQAHPQGKAPAPQAAKGPVPLQLQPQPLQTGAAAAKKPKTKQPKKQEPEAPALSLRTRTAAAMACNKPAPVDAPSAASKDSGQAKFEAAMVEFDTKIKACGMKLMQISTSLQQKDISLNTYLNTMKTCRETLQKLEASAAEAAKSKVEAESNVKKFEALSLSLTSEVEKSRQKLVDAAKGVRITWNLQKNLANIDQKILEVQRGGDHKGPRIVDQLEKAKTAAMEFNAKQQELKANSPQHHAYLAQHADTQIIHIRLQQAAILERLRQAHSGLKKNRTEIVPLMTERNALLQEIKDHVEGMRLARKQEHERLIDSAISNWQEGLKTYHAQIEEGHKRRTQELAEKEAQRAARTKQIKKIVTVAENPYEAEIATCNDLINYVQQIKRTSAPAHSKGKKQSLQVKMGSFKLFELIGVAVPLTPEDLPIALKTLQDKKAAFQAKAAEQMKAKASTKPPTLAAEEPKAISIAPATIPTEPVAPETTPETPSSTTTAATTTTTTSTTKTEPKPEPEAAPEPEPATEAAPTEEPKTNLE